MNKIHFEQEDFKESIIALPKKMIHHCYKYAVKVDIVYYIEGNELVDEENLALKY